MTQLHVSAFRDSLRARSLAERIPLSVLFEITPTCNLRCHFCYVALDPYAGPYLALPGIEAVFDKFVEAGVLFLTLTGGEIFSRRDFPDIYRAAKARGFVVSLYSNATMVTTEIAELLRSDPPQEVEVSIYGADAEHYEATTGIKGSYARFARGIDLLRGAGLNILMKHVVSTFSEDHIPQIRAWCESRGLPLKPSVLLENRHSGGTQPSLYRISPRKVMDVRDYVHEERTGRKRSGPIAGCSEVVEGSEAQMYRCGAGRTAFFVDALGQASHCVLDRQPSFSLLEMEWADIWAGIGAWVTQPLPKDAPCADCGLRAGCENCPARARASTGDPFGHDPYHCDVTHAEYGYEPGVHVPRSSPAPRPAGSCAH